MANSERTYENGGKVVVERGLELSLALGRAMVARLGPDFGHEVGEHFEARMSEQASKGGNAAIYAEAAREAFVDFDWTTFTATPGGTPKAP